jgi:hypothetical protein
MTKLGVIPIWEGEKTSGGGVKHHGKTFLRTELSSF